MPNNGRRNLARSTPEQLVAEIRQAREDLEDTARYMAEASMLLHTKTRQAPFREAARQTANIPEGTHREAAERLQQAALSEVSSIYTLYANTWQRFAGMVLQGVRRTTSSERIMRRFEEKRGVATEVEEEAPPPAPRPVLVPETQNPMEDLVELYGVETVNHAQR